MNAFIRTKFSHAGSKGKIWLFSTTSPSHGYEIVGGETTACQTALESSPHYRAPAIPQDSTLVCYTDGFRYMDFTYSESQPDPLTPLLSGMFTEKEVELLTKPLQPSQT